ncbi:MAG: long-chain fatty acid--CoA ligase [Pseudonocardiales bacterium]|nr:long-chain fatty acid--CoA ligase [Pseudonocardiales bacterium]
MQTTTEPSTIDLTLSQPSLPLAFLARASASPNSVALSTFGSDSRLTVGEWASQARAVAGGLAALGVRRGDRVALLLGTRIEFQIADVGLLLLGAIPISLYVTSPVSQLLEIAQNAEPRVLITEAALADKARELVAAHPAIQHLIVIEDDAVRADELSLAALKAGCADDFDAIACAQHAEISDTCTLVYTSGTTGPPKGVQIRHGSVLACLDSIRHRFPTSELDRAVCYLPMAHVAERIFGHYAAFVYGYEVTSVPTLAQLGAALQAVRPTRFFGVPRIYEKLLAGVHRAIEESPQPDQPRAALRSRVDYVRAQQAGDHLPDEAADYANRETLRPFAELTGLDQAHFVAVAGAPSSLEMLEEATALGIPVNEFYGSSEVSIVTCSPPDRIRLGTAGTPLPGARLRLADDGEVLIAGPTVTSGYYRDPTRTAELLEPDGWFHTGDIGELGDDGYIRIVDRKKELIINSFGKNMSPANIEQAIKGGQPFISQVLAFGDRRPYNVALVALDRDGICALLHILGQQPGEFAEMSQRPAVIQAVADAVELGNQRLSRVEQIKTFRVLDHDWLPGSDELTPTSKLRRRVIETKYAAEIDALYAGGAS